MKKLIIICFAISFTGFAFVALQLRKFIDAEQSEQLERMNARIKQLHDSGCSWEEVRKIGASEAGFKPVDSNYILIQK